MTADLLPEAIPHYTPGAERLLAAASELFYREGIHAVGVDTIAAAAGVTKKTLYDRFGSKEALAVAYLRGRDARWRVYFDRELAQQPEGSIDRILAVFDISAQWSRENGEKGCSAINARAETSDAADPVAVEATRQKVWLRGVFEQLCRDAAIADAEPVANSLMLLYEGGLVTTGMGTFADPFAVGRQAAALILAGAERSGIEKRQPIPSR
ncbi:TetR family transcriptional regulator [Glaciihabitans tibetensis]|uniref:TetR family transcriptional regulator n=1 Tax=Glaciihabitans tibetensis TaxID=1266600 RepID=A0A2T0VDX4_9MICO|nr:TetR/AcrR family transcriptional regulator [Glaciihabitans tibetensis]PRY68332.1 TetR family transcriptional regulator [Glaciihabitans tibetensis]